MAVFLFLPLSDVRVTREKVAPTVKAVAAESIICLTSATVTGAAFGSGVIPVDPMLPANPNTENAEPSRYIDSHSSQS